MGIKFFVFELRKDFYWWVYNFVIFFSHQLQHRSFFAPNDHVVIPACLPFSITLKLWWGEVIRAAPVTENNSTFSSSVFRKRWTNSRN